MTTVKAEWMLGVGVVYCSRYSVSINCVTVVQHVAEGVLAVSAAGGCA